MADEILNEIFSVIGVDLIGDPMIFGIVVVGLILTMLVYLRLPANIVFAFIFPAILALTASANFPIWIKAAASLLIGLVWFFVMKSMIYE